MIFGFLIAKVSANFIACVKCDSQFVFLDVILPYFFHFLVSELRRLMEQIIVVFKLIYHCVDIAASLCGFNNIVK